MYRSPVLAVALGLCAAGCGSSGPTTSTTPTTTAPPNTLVFTAALNSANEVPAPVGPETSGTGAATMTFHLTRDSTNAITSANVDFVASFTGYPAGTILTAAHIHPGAAGIPGPVVISTNIVGGEVTMPNGSGSLVMNAQPADLTDTNLIIANPATYYFNIHTATNPAGVSRGQLVAKQ